jgi:2-polyprenyl-6-methoxyphenol hydroxylase-like FAD-dependent oxidoreductase
VDRALFPRSKACAEYLSPEAGRDLEALGVVERVEAAAPARLRGFRLVSDDGRSVTGYYAGIPGHTPYRPFGYALPRAVLDAIVLDAARDAGATVREGVSCERLEWSGRSVTGAVLRDGARTTAVRAQVVVGADGLHSRVARQLGVARAGRPRRIALVAHLSGVANVTDVGEMFAQRGWYVGLADVGGGLTNVAMAVPLRSARGAGAGGGAGRNPERFLRAQLARIPELRERCAGAVVAREVMVTGPFARHASRVVHDGALLVGDAADFFDPFTGEGMFAALRGGRLAAAAIATALASGDTSRTALAPYAAARRRAFRGKWMLERLVGLGSVQPHLMRRFTRRLARRPSIANLWVSAAGDSVPVGELFRPRNLVPLLL